MCLKDIERTLQIFLTIETKPKLKLSTNSGIEPEKPSLPLKQKQASTRLPNAIHMCNAPLCRLDQSHHDESGFVIPQRFRHDSGPQFDPVPTGVIFFCTFSFARSCPKAALISSKGKPFVKSWPRFVVPVSSEGSAETSWAFSQPRRKVCQSGSSYAPTSPMNV